MTAKSLAVSTPPDIHLDLGCGHTPRNPYRRGTLCGVDVIAAGSTRDFEYRQANLAVEPIPWPDNTFGSVSAFDFLEHVPRVLATSQGTGTRLPFIELMNEVWRVLAPGGLFYAVTPCYPRMEAFQDPTHVNIITARTHVYFCGAEPMGRMYGFRGTFGLLNAEWALMPEAFSAQFNLPWRRAYKKWKHTREERLSHFLWQFAAVKPNPASA